VILVGILSSLDIPTILIRNKKQMAYPIITRKDLTPEQVISKLKDRNRRLNSGILYHIRDKAGRNVPYIRNEAQAYLSENQWYRNIIPKARQL
jgi:hypothetical protein